MAETRYADSLTGSWLAERLGVDPLKIEAMRRDGELIAFREPGADDWRTELGARSSDGWLTTDWFFAETYAYRQLAERARYWETARDPFLTTKREEYAGSAHAEALDRALALEGSLEERLHALFGLALFGNRIDPGRR